MRKVEGLSFWEKNSLQGTNSSHLKNSGWKRIVSLLGRLPGRYYVSSLEGIYLCIAFGTLVPWKGSICVLHLVKLFTDIFCSTIYLIGLSDVNREIFEVINWCVTHTSCLFQNVGQFGAERHVAFVFHSKLKWQMHRRGHGGALHMRCRCSWWAVTGRVFFFSKRCSEIWMA